MPCNDAFDAFRQATEFLDEDLLRRAYYKSVWLNVIRRGEYMRGSGLNLRVFTLERSVPTSDNETWPKVAFASGDASSCGTTWNDVNYGHTERSYAPEQFGLRGPILCKDDLIYDWNTDDFLEGYLNALMHRSLASLENRYMAIYSHFVDKNVTNSTFTKTNGSSGTLPTAGPDLSGMKEATCRLDQIGHLENVALELIEEGATTPDSDGWINMGEDGPIFPLYIGIEASQQILRANAELRQDYRDADSGAGTAAALLKRIGATKVIGNFRHIPNLFPARFHWVPTGSGNGHYQRVNTWVMPAKSKGNGGEINPQWRDAPFEAAYVLSPWVYQSNVIRPVNASNNLRWMPTDYFGEWQFVTGGTEIDPDVDCHDPLKKLGRHFAEYKHAPKPLFPKYGRMIIFRRCPDSDSTCITCAS